MMKLLPTAAILAGFALGSYFETPRATAQGSAMEQTIQTTVMRDLLRAQVSILEELRTLNATLRRFECFERRKNYNLYPPENMLCKEGTAAQ